jgi:hypothetical protein
MRSTYGPKTSSGSGWQARASATWTARGSAASGWATTRTGQCMTLDIMHEDYVWGFHQMTSLYMMNSGNCLTQAQAAGWQVQSLGGTATVVRTTRDVCRGGSPVQTVGCT